MKLPASPPPFKPDEQDPARFSRIARAAIDLGPLVNSRYMHWDDLRRRSPPEKLTLEQWWFALKLARARGLDIPDLRSVDGRPFSYLLVDPIPAQLHRIDRDAGGRIEMPEQVTNPDTRDRYLISSLMEESVTSSLLEGAGTTRAVAKDMLRTQREPKTRGERMVLNNYVTMERIRELRDEPLSVEMILEIHHLVTDGTLEDSDASGRFRTSAESVVVGDEYGTVFHLPAPAEEIERRVQQMCEFGNGASERFVHPAVRAIILHFWLAYDHPFTDGNGRTARALFYWSMLNAGYSLFEFVSISKVIHGAPLGYYRAFLLTESDDNDLTYFLLYHLKVIDRAIEGLHAYIQRKTEEVQTSERQIRGLAALNHRQKALVAHALRHPNARYTFQSHQHSSGISYETSRSDLLGLEKRKFLRKRVEGRQHVFLPPRERKPFSDSETPR